MTVVAHQNNHVENGDIRYKIDQLGRENSNFVESNLEVTKF